MYLLYIDAAGSLALLTPYWKIYSREYICTYVNTCIEHVSYAENMPSCSTPAMQCAAATARPNVCNSCGAWAREFAEQIALKRLGNLYTRTSALHSSNTVWMRNADAAAASAPQHRASLCWEFRGKHAAFNRPVFGSIDRWSLLHSKV